MTCQKCPHAKRPDWPDRGRLIVCALTKKTEHYGASYSRTHVKPGFRPSWCPATALAERRAE